MTSRLTKTCDFTSLPSSLSFAKNRGFLFWLCFMESFESFNRLPKNQPHTNTLRKAMYRFTQSAPFRNRTQLKLRRSIPSGSSRWLASTLEDPQESHTCSLIGGQSGTYDYFKHSTRPLNERISDCRYKGHPKKRGVLRNKAPCNI